MEIGTNIGTHGMGAGLLQAMEKLVQPEGKPDGKLALDGQEIHSLAELRERFALHQIMEAFLDGSLEAWLKGCYYEEESQKMQGLEKEDTFAVEQRLCNILGVDYAAREDLSPEQKEAFSRRRELLRRHGAGTEVFSHVAETATNQVELAELLNAGCSVIYLCDGDFTVPIHKSGVHYVGVDHPRMTAPFTEEQYRRAGITFEGVDLPDTANEEAERIAQSAARKAGYDDFEENHTPLAALVHKRIKGIRVTKHFHLDAMETDVGCEEYRSKFAAQRAAHAVVNQAYDTASALFALAKSNCIAPQFAERYANQLCRGMGHLAEKLGPKCVTERQKGLLLRLTELTEKAEENLKELFFKELRDSADYYELYQRKYFLDRVTVEREENSEWFFDSDFMNELASLATATYTVSDIYECIAELQEDVNSRADTFADTAYQRYEEYCEKLEELAEELGEGFTKDDLVRMKLIEG